MLRLFTLKNGLLGLIFAGYFFFGFQHLTHFVTADEHYWLYERIPQYWKAVSKQEWKKTFINDKPGVTLALVSGIGLFFEPHPEKYFYEDHSRILVYDIPKTEQLLLLFRLPILVINGFLLLLIFFILKRLTDEWVALFATALTALSPILIGISQIINPDALLWSFSAAALFSFFALLQYKERKFLWLTILCTGFAILTKYVAVILLPFYCGLALLRFFASKKDADILIASLKKDLLSFAGIALGSAALFVFFLPAVLFDQKYILEFLATVPNKTGFFLAGGALFGFCLFDTFVLKNTFFLAFRKMFHISAGSTRFLPLIIASLFIGIIAVRNLSNETLFDRIPFDAKDITDARYFTAVPTFVEAFILEWNPLVFSFTPLVLLGLFLLLFALIKKRSVPHPFLAQTLLFFSVAYAVLLVFSNVLATPRYSIILYPLFALLSALGIRSFTKIYSFKKNELLTAFIIIIGSFVSIITIHPFYFNYTNSLLPTSRLIHDAWGYGGYEAAEYLNSLPDAKNLTVWIDYYGVCEFFVGKCLSAYTFDPRVIKPDYYVLTRRGKIRYMSRRDRWEERSGLTAYKYYDIPNPDWELLIDGRPSNFVRVVKVVKNAE